MSDNGHVNGTNDPSLRLRVARASIRRSLANGTASIADVLLDPAGVPDCIVGRTLAEIASWRRGWGPAKVRELGRFAIRDRVNLLAPAGAASCRSREWLAARDREFGRYPARKAAA